MQYVIEPFRGSDADAVSLLFLDALNDHYGGDHRAHLKRLLIAYENNNVDQIGFSSTHQYGVVARCPVTGTTVGFLNYVIKRQNTAKISPLIVARDARRSGVARQLLAYMHRALSGTPIRNIYCTVDKHNKATVRFFTRAGFRVLGSSRDQYLNGHCELILQRIVDEPIDRQAHHGFSLTLAAEQRQWDDFQAAWPLLHANERDAHDPSELHAHASRSCQMDIEQKPKVVYFCYCGTQFAGAMVLCPKKGGSTKISSAFWRDSEALAAMLAALEHTDEFRSTIGRVYVQMPMAANPVRVLQSQGWRLDAVIPGKEADDAVIGQWSTHVNDAALEHLMEWPDYQLALRQVVEHREWQKFETPQELLVSLMAEVGELAQELQWKSQWQAFDLDKASIAAELADVYNYLLRLSWHLDIDLLAACFEKLEEVCDKYPVDQARGSAEKYTSLLQAGV
jgi:ribosomal protein S18 acetylase RimI-like enzyme/NTP pyrophosphatase (non-canonical NTP hydrolase)